MKYLIWSFEHGMWWKANRSGYAFTVREAGRYTPEEAIEILCCCIPPGEEFPVREREASDDRWPATSAHPASPMQEAS